MLLKNKIPSNTIIPGFGMSETCGGSIYSMNFQNEFNTLEFGTMGHPIKGLDIRVVDNENNIVPNGQLGELQLKGEVIFKGYFNNGKENIKAFTHDKWFKTGDIGKINHENKSLEIVGRIKDTIIVNGINYNLSELNSLLNEHIEGIIPSYIVAFPTRKLKKETESLVIFYVPQGKNNIKNLELINENIRNYVIRYWGFRPALILPVSMQEMGKTSLGKIQVKKLKTLYENGHFDEVIRRYTEIKKKNISKSELPRNEFERKIIGIFSDITNLKNVEIGIDSNFFDLGGTSLELLKLLTMLKEQFKNTESIKISDLLINPTPRMLSKILNNEKDNKYNPIVTLQKEGNKNPLFLIHPGVGEVLVFINLANLFAKKRPVYALRARGFNANEKYFESIEEMVNIYVDAIKAKQNKGTFNIAGYSYGGPIALPIAKKLEREGHKVNLIIIDAPPDIKHPRGKVDLIESVLMLSFFIGLIKENDIDIINKILRDDKNIDPVKYIFDNAPLERVRELGLEFNAFKNWSDLSYNLAKIGEQYIPKGIVNKVKVLYAQPIWGDKEEYLNKALYKWDNYSKEIVEYINIPGKHHNIFENKYVFKLYEVINSELEKS